MSRPSHDALMAAQEQLGQARDIERDAGNLAVSRYLNDLTLSIFRVSLDEEMDAHLTEAYRIADAEGGR